MNEVNETGKGQIPTDQVSPLQLFVTLFNSSSQSLSPQGYTLESVIIQCVASGFTIYFWVTVYNRLTYYVA